LDKNVSSRREFLLYWLGLFVVAFSFVSILLSISGLVTNIINTQCYYPYISPMLGIKEPQSPPSPIASFAIPPNATVTGVQTGYEVRNGPMMPYPYCGGNLAAYVIQFVFSLLASLIFVGVGVYMMLNGKKQ
jgi:hypothetical protein